MVKKNVFAKHPFGAGSIYAIVIHEGRWEPALLPLNVFFNYR